MAVATDTARDARVHLLPADWQRVDALARAERRSRASMLGVLVAEALAARERGAPRVKAAPTPYTKLRGGGQ